jgi:hypothetical protein
MDPTNNIDNEGAWGWLNNFCRDHPTDEMWQVVPLSPDFTLIEFERCH